MPDAAPRPAEAHFARIVVGAELAYPGVHLLATPHARFPREDVEVELLMQKLNEAHLRVEGCADLAPLAGILGDARVVLPVAGPPWLGAALPN
ncbi:MAG: hypothetical protein ABSC94_06795 [Polyangiaceae bacterium]